MMEDGWTPTTSKSLPSHHCLLSVHSKSARATADNGWLPTYTEEPAATSPSTVGRHSRSARPTAGHRRTLIVFHMIAVVMYLFIVMMLVAAYYNKHKCS